MNESTFSAHGELWRQVETRLAHLGLAGLDFLPSLPGAIDREIEDALYAPAEAPPPAPEDLLAARRVSLEVLRKSVSDCTRCPELASTRSQTVFGTGPLSPDLLILGEAPGADEDKQGVPFIGAAGQLLTRILAAGGFSRDEVAIVNVLKCRPPGNRTPKPDECANCRDYLLEQVRILQPRYVLAMGVTAMTNAIGPGWSIARARGKFHPFREMPDIPVLATYHPANLLEGRSPENKKLVWEDMQLLVKTMGRQLPSRVPTPPPTRDGE